MNERASDASVPIGEGVDRLELRMRDGRLSDGRQVAARDELHQVRHRRRDARRCGRHEIGSTRSLVGAPDPVLDVAEAAGMRSFERILAEERAMRGEDVPQTDPRRRCRLHEPLDRLDVRRDVSSRLRSARSGERGGQLGLLGVDALDLRRSDRLGANQLRPERPDVELRMGIERGDGGRGVG